MLSCFILFYFIFSVVVFALIVDPEHPAEAAHPVGIVTIRSVTPVINRGTKGFLALSAKKHIEQLRIEKWSNVVGVISKY